MKKPEAKFQIKFKHYIETNPPKNSTAYELKYEKGGTFNFSLWTKKQPHQLRSLLQSKNKSLYYKISDSAIGFKPFDCFVLTKADAFLIIYFEKHKTSIQVNTEYILNLLHSGKKSASFYELLEKNTKLQI